MTAVTDQDHTEHADRPGDGDKAGPPGVRRESLCTGLPGRQAGARRRRLPRARAGQSYGFHGCLGRRAHRTPCQRDRRRIPVRRPGQPARRPARDETAGVRRGVALPAGGAARTRGPVPYPARRQDACRGGPGAGRGVGPARLSGHHTVVAIAGATGSGKSPLFNALAGVAISETGVRRPPPPRPSRALVGRRGGLLERLGIPAGFAAGLCRPGTAESPLHGLVLSTCPTTTRRRQHRDQVDRILASSTRSSGSSTPRSTPTRCCTSATCGRWRATRRSRSSSSTRSTGCPGRPPSRSSTTCGGSSTRTASPSGSTANRVRPCSRCPRSPGTASANCARHSASSSRSAGRRPAVSRPTWTTPRHGCGPSTPPGGGPGSANRPGGVRGPARRRGGRHGGGGGGRTGVAAQRQPRVRDALAEVVALVPGPRRTHHGAGPLAHGGRRGGDRRQRVEQAVRTVADRASAGLPAPWAQAVREAAVRGSQGLPEALDELTVRAGVPTGGRRGRGGGRWLCCPRPP